MTNHYAVLVVDDEPDCFQVTQALLIREGYSLSYVTSGQEALTRMGTLLPDVILLDVMMPDLDGIETCHRIKSNADWQHIPIIMITALNSRADLARCMAAGANDFISKPINGLELRARVHSMLRMKQQYDALKATLQLREDLSNMVVHDLRNPIAAVLLASQLLLERDVLAGPNLAVLQRIHMAGQMLNSRVNDLLMIAKMESGKMLLKRAEVNLNTLSSLVISEFQEVAEAKHIVLEPEIPVVGRCIYADANSLHRLIDNLLSNAIKFSPKYSKVTLRIHYPTVSTPDCNSRQAVIQVIDEGFGISEEVRNTIFNKFEIGDSIQGVTQIGLGLTFCKLVVDAHNGTITVEPNHPQGSIFTVEI